MVQRLQGTSCCRYAHCELAVTTLHVLSIPTCAKQNLMRLLSSHAPILTKLPYPASWLQPQLHEAANLTSAIPECKLDHPCQSLHVCRFALPLKDLQWHVHYNMELVLDVPSASEQASLFVTLYLAKCPALEAKALQAMQQQQLSVMQARVTSLPELTR